MEKRYNFKMETENITLKKPPKCVCPKHGDIRDDYVFRVNMPEFGYEKMSFCLVCAVEYLAMISQEIQYVAQDDDEEEETKE
jgi:hypothetical protein